ncbi:hypothetical protein [Mycolicibacterium canariasense]|uniref:hypothetical protein n=1 Tax=Mycolicibacterium canariasense TaxID=228230 RepID=UPI000A15819A|nr:hypothetical protein [Mycolicibacterium canariasense]MCV7208395.1 hypothetical protein [Mycolicibacterium canariasense]ORV13577.1 hypothetical protein AWB94_04985 [Mycolicibacterium canariasense]
MPQKVILPASIRRKHGVNKRNALAVMRNCSAPVAQESGSVLYTGRDTNGRLTEIGVIDGREGGNVLVIIHALPLEWER